MNFVRWILNYPFIWYFFEIKSIISKVENRFRIQLNLCEYIKILDCIGKMEPAQPIQILTPSNHEFNLELQNLKEIFEKDDIKDRFVVAVAIAGAFRKGKSFLLNYFLRYLNAQVSQKINSDNFFHKYQNNFTSSFHLCKK